MSEMHGFNDSREKIIVLVSCQPKYIRVLFYVYMYMYAYECSFIYRICCAFMHAIVEDTLRAN